MTEEHFSDYIGSGEFKIKKETPLPKKAIVYFQGKHENIVPQNYDISRFKLVLDLNGQKMYRVWDKKKYFVVPKNTAFVVRLHPVQIKDLHDIGLKVIFANRDTSSLLYEGGYMNTENPLYNSIFRILTKQFQDKRDSHRMRILEFELK